MTLFGFTIIKWPTADKLEGVVSKLMERVAGAEGDLGVVGGALTASIDLQQKELVRINVMRSKLQQILK